MLCACNITGMCVNKMETQAVLWPSALWGSSHHFGFALVIETLETWSLFFCPPCKDTMACFQPLSPFIFHTLPPILFLFRLSLPLPFISQLATLVICVYWTQLTWSPWCCPRGFHFGHALHFLSKCTSPRL